MPAEMGTPEYYAEHEARRNTTSKYEDLDAKVRGKGNIDLNGRPVFIHPNGQDYSSLESISVEVDNGKHILIPTVVDGKLLSQDEAVQHAFKTKQILGVFDSQEEASKHAVDVEARQNAYYEKTPEGRALLDASFKALAERQMKEGFKKVRGGK